MNMNPLKVLAEKLGIYIGFAARNNFWQLPDVERCMEIAQEEFNILIK